MDDTLNPKRKTIVSKSKNPIIIVLDVTGSNINFARLVYDKFPMFYGEIESKKYFKDFDISLIAIGDIATDKYPLQVCDFAKGIELDSWLEKIVLEGNGGGNGKESYDLAALYLLNKFDFEKDAKPIIFFIGDEAPYGHHFREDFEICGLEEAKKESDCIKKLVEKFNNVYMLLNKYCGRDFSSSITKEWEERLEPEHTVKIQEEKSIVDIILGILALMSKIGLEQYSIDMKNRGQSIDRLLNVKSSLEKLSKSLVKIEDVSMDLTTQNPMKKTFANSKRI